MTHRTCSAVRSVSTLLLAGCLVAGAIASAGAATPPAGAAPPAADVDRLRKEVAELRQMLLGLKESRPKIRIKTSATRERGNTA